MNREMLHLVASVSKEKFRSKNNIGNKMPRVNFMGCKYFPVRP